MTAPAQQLSLGATIRADLTAMVRLKGDAQTLTLGSAADVLTLPGTWAVLLYRVATWLHHHHLKPVSRMLYFANVVLFGADLGPGANIGPGLAIAHPVFCGWGRGLVMGSNVVISGGVRFAMASVEDESRAGEPIVGDGCFFFDGAKVLGHVRIGDGAVIAANALVLEDVPAEAVVVGAPARVIRYRSDPEGSSKRPSGEDVPHVNGASAEPDTDSEGVR